MDFPRQMRVGMPIIYREEGLKGLYKGLSPLWFRQVPYTMMKFWAFERTVEAIYKNFIPKPKAQCTKLEQLGVSFLGGYIAGVFCAIVSHPADVVVSKLNQFKTDGGTGAAIKKIFGELGLKVFYLGIGTRIIMIGTLTALQWFIYDSFKIYAGLPTTGAKVEKYEAHAPVTVPATQKPVAKISAKETQSSKDTKSSKH